MHHRWKLLLNNGQSFRFHSLSPYKSWCKYTCSCSNWFVFPNVKNEFYSARPCFRFSQNYQISVIIFSHIIKMRSINFCYPFSAKTNRRDCVCMCIKWPKAHVPEYLPTREYFSFRFANSSARSTSTHSNVNHQQTYIWTIVDSKLRVVCVFSEAMHSS